MSTFAQKLKDISDQKIAQKRETDTARIKKEVEKIFEGFEDMCIRAANNATSDDDKQVFVADIDMGDKEKKQLVIDKIASFGLSSSSFRFGNADRIYASWKN